MTQNYNLFDNNTINPKKAEKRNDYEAFVKKFKPKLTTDDCYTPPAAYDVVLNYVAKNYDLIGKNILRPFKPNGDYQSETYDENTVVIDNPPFSILTKIARYYLERKIPFFLFAPHLVLFSGNLNVTYIVTLAKITYENGAIVPTSFITNMFGDGAIIADVELTKQFDAIQYKELANLPKYTYPENLLTVSTLSILLRYGISLTIPRKEVSFTSSLESQRKIGKTIYGAGFLLSDKAAAEKAAAEKAAAKKAAAEKQNRIVWELSEKEKAIIKALGEGNEAGNKNYESNQMSLF